MTGAQLSQALDLARLGYHVFSVDHPDLPTCVGVRTREHDPDSCTERGKHPCGAWSRQATTDPERIVAMFGGHPRNIGIACGPSGLVVLDEDAADELVRFCAAVGQPVPGTMRVRTAKGFHHYFLAVDGVRISNAEGALRDYAINVRGAGGYVVGPGSKHAGGVVYEVVNGSPILTLPPFLVGAVTGNGASAPERLFQDPVVYAPSPADETGPIPENKRHETLMRYAASLRARNVRLDEAEVLMRPMWERCVQPPQASVPRTWEHALGTLHDVYRRYPAGSERTVGDPGPTPGGAAEAVERRVRLTPAIEIKPRPVRWLWEARVPIGELTVTPGRGDIGKSTFHAWLIAELTRGRLPGVYLGTPRACVIATTEESWERTVVPRLMAADADLRLVQRADVVVTETGEDTVLVLPRDVDGLAAAMGGIGAVLLSVDPLISGIDGRLDTHRDREVRSALEPLRRRLAEPLGAVVLGNAHFGKGRGDALSLIMGSVAFSNVPRAALAFARDDQAEDGSCVITQAKNNLGRTDLPSLRYRIEAAYVDTDEGPAEVGRLVMLGESERSVHDILRDHGNGDDGTDQAEAEQWLVAYLTDKGGTTGAGDAIKAAARDGIPSHTLQRARKRIGVKSSKPGMASGWVWTLPGTAVEDDTKMTKMTGDGRLSPSSPSGPPEPSPACLQCGQPGIPPGYTYCSRLCAEAHRGATGEGHP
jgi:Bifunctional DNA primase/polymerase, N-terminal/AAA domain